MARRAAAHAAPGPPQSLLAPHAGWPGPARVRGSRCRAVGLRGALAGWGADGGWGRAGSQGRGACCEVQEELERRRRRRRQANALACAAPSSPLCSPTRHSRGVPSSKSLSTLPPCRAGQAQQAVGTGVGSERARQQASFDGVAAERGQRPTQGSSRAAGDTSRQPTAGVGYWQQGAGYQTQGLGRALCDRGSTRWRQAAAAPHGVGAGRRPPAQAVMHRPCAALQASAISGAPSPAVTVPATRPAPA